MAKFPLCVFFLLAAGPALAASNVYGRAEEKLRYDNCLSLAGLNPTAAVAVAEDWRKAKGGAPAEHCAAVALVGLKQYPQAAARLDALGRAPGMGNLRASIFDQAGNAWLLAGDAPRAVASFSAALTLSANDADLYADLARAQALQKDWRGVEADLNAALALAPKRTDLLILRSSARQALGKLLLAQGDAEAALRLRPNDAGAILQRGTIRRDAGDLKGAREDFIVALRTANTADEARRNIAALDAASRPPAKPPAKAAKK